MSGPDEERELFRRLLTALPGDALRGVEIGVLNGETSGFLLALDPRIHLVGIDPIVRDSMEYSLIGSIERIRSNTAAHSERWTFIRDYSESADDRFDDGSLDFVFIDGSHHYEDVRRDWALYYPKVKSGGLMFLHDSRMSRGGARFHPGPSKLADELIGAGYPLVGEAFSLTAFEVR